MKLFITITVLLLLTLWQPAISAHNGIYITAETGWANQTGVAADDDNVTVKKLSGIKYPAVRGSVGYIHDFVKSFGMGFEVGLGYFGKSTYRFNNDSKFRLASFTTDFLVVLVTHLHQVDLIGKIGGIRHSITLEGDDFKTENNVIQQVEAAAGIGYNISPHFAVILNYTHTFGGDNVNDLCDVSLKSPSLNEVLIGMRFTFF